MENRKKKKTTFFRVKPKLTTIGIRVARWFVFKPKIPIWGNFGGP
jgi:hypothetical protein